MHNYNFALTYLLFFATCYSLLWSYASRRYFISDTLSSGLFYLFMSVFLPKGMVIKNLELNYLCKMYLHHQTFKL